MTFWQKSILFLCLSMALTVVVMTTRQIVITDTPAEYRAFINGKIVTLDKNQSTHSAMLLKGNRVLAIGNDDSILRQLPANHVVDDLQGNVLLPGKVSYNEKSMTELSNTQKLLEKGITTVFVTQINNEDLKALYLKRRHGLIDIRIMIDSELGEELKVPPFIDLDTDERFYVKQLSKLSDEQIINGGRSIETLFNQSLGSLEPGKMADFVILDTTELARLKELDKVKVNQTWLDGVRKY